MGEITENPLAPPLVTVLGAAFTSVPNAFHHNGDGADATKDVTGKAGADEFVLKAP